MRIAMASDHAGRALKEEIKALLRADGHEISDFGTDTDDAADLPDHVYPAALAVARGDVDRGIFVDGVGYGSAMIANKIAGIYAAVCQDPFCAELARSHSDTNVLCLGGKIIGSAIALEIVRVWMATEWLRGRGRGRREVRPTGQQGEGHRRPAPRALGLRTQAAMTISRGSDSTCRRQESERGGTWSDLCLLQRRKAVTCLAFPQTDPVAGAMSRSSLKKRTLHVDSEPAGYVERCGTAYLYIDRRPPMFTDMPRSVRSGPSGSSRDACGLADERKFLLRSGYRGGSAGVAPDMFRMTTPVTTKTMPSRPRMVTSSPKTTIPKMTTKAERLPSRPCRRCSSG